MIIPDSELSDLICYAGFYDHCYYDDEIKCYIADDDWYDNLFI